MCQCLLYICVYCIPTALSLNLITRFFLAVTDILALLDRYDHSAYCFKNLIQNRRMRNLLNTV